VLRRGAIAAIVGDGPAPRSTASTLRRHDRTLRELAARFPAILPARFGTALSEDELLFILSSRRASLARTLSSVHGRVQMTVRIVGAPGASSAASAESAVGHPFKGASDTGAASGRDYLMGKVRDAAAARNVPGFDPIRKAVARWIREERVDRRVGVASVYHLIPRGSVEAYRRGIREAAHAAGVPLVVSGPWPPYAFAGD
jgi:alkylated DNA nucleotide flippase Atl1